MFAAASVDVDVAAAEESDGSISTAAGNGAEAGGVSYVYETQKAKLFSDGGVAFVLSTDDYVRGAIAKSGAASVPGQFISADPGRFYELEVPWSDVA